MSVNFASHCFLKHPANEPKTYRASSTSAAFLAGNSNQNDVSHRLQDRVVKLEKALKNIFGLLKDLRPIKRHVSELVTASKRVTESSPTADTSWWRV